MQAEGGKGGGGGLADVGNGYRRRNGDYRVAGVGNFQMDSLLCWERKLRAGVIEKCYNAEWLLMGGISRKE